MQDQFLFVHVNEWGDYETPDAIPISQGFILANLEQHGYSGAILGDYKNRPLSPQLFKTQFNTTRPAVLGFSVYEENINRIRSWARFAKSLNNNVRVVLGGPQTTFMPGEALQQMPEADILCRGDGETVMLDLANTLAANRPLVEVPGICCRDNGHIIETGPNHGPEDLDTLPSPYLNATIDTSGKSRVILLSSRGCTSPCTFCYTTRASGRTVRFHSIDRIVEEIRYLKKRGISDFWFADPNFAFSKKRLVALLEAIIAKVPGITFWCQTRYNLIDPDLLKLLKHAGAHTIAFGLESAHDETLTRIRKGLDPARMSDAIRLTQEAGINVELFTLFGLPGETRENAVKTLEYVNRHGVDIEGNSISQQLHLFFGTPISEDPSAHGVQPLPVTRPAYQSICRDFATDCMSGDEIRQMSLLWRINRKDFEEDIENGCNLFRIAGLITAHKEMLAWRPEADILLAAIYRHLDEVEAAASCLHRLHAKFPDHPRVKPLLNPPFVAYKSKRRGVAARGCRIIFDCKGFLDGQPVPETECYFATATLDGKSLIRDFETGLIGCKAGSTTQFDAVFPPDYPVAHLAGKRVVFQACLHQVLEPVVFTDIEEMLADPPRNMYRFHDLINVKKHNENLYYMVLRDSTLHSFTGNLTHMMDLFNFYLKLGFREKALDIAYATPQEPSIRGHIGRVLLANELPGEAMEFLDQAAGMNAEIESQRIKALIRLERYDEAEEVAANPLLTTNLKTMNLRVKLAAARQLPVSTYLARMDTLLDAQVKMMHANMH